MVFKVNTPPVRCAPREIFVVVHVRLCQRALWVPSSLAFGTVACGLGLAAQVSSFGHPKSAFEGVLEVPPQKKAAFLKGFYIHPFILLGNIWKKKWMKSPEKNSRTCQENMSGSASLLFGFCAELHI